MPGPAPVTDALPGIGRTPACPSSHPPSRLSAHPSSQPPTTCWSASTPTPPRTPSPSSTPLPEHRSSTASSRPAQPGYAEPWPGSNTAPTAARSWSSSTARLLRSGARRAAHRRRVHRRRGTGHPRRRAPSHGKTDHLDATELARAARGLTDQQLRRPRRAGDRTILRVLTTARDQMTGERTRAINALTALLRTVDLDVDARRALSAATITTIAAWRTTSVSTTARAVCRNEAIRLARHILALDAELAANPHRPRHSRHRPGPRTAPGSRGRPVVAATVLQAWAHARPHPLRGRVRRSRRVPHPYRPHRATPDVTDSTAAGTGDSTERSTPSP